MYLQNANISGHSVHAKHISLLRIYFRGQRKNCNFHRILGRNFTELQDLSYGNGENISELNGLSIYYWNFQENWLRFSFSTPIQEIQKDCCFVVYKI